MKIMKKITGQAIMLSLVLSGIAAAEEIALPDVTTVVSGNEVKVGKDALPDFSKIITDENTAASPLIKLPEPSVNQEESAEAVPAVSVKTEKDLFVEGQIGGGYPGLFSGNFSIYRQIGKNPFLLQFSHESVHGYSGEADSDGFFDDSTDVSGKKAFNFDSCTWNFSGAYNKSCDGLQKVSSAFYDVTKQTVEADAEVSFSPLDQITVTVGSDSTFYSRFSGTSGNAAARKFETGAYIFSFVPKAKAEWKSGPFEIELNGSYFQQDNLKDDLYLSSTSLNDQTTYRGAFGGRLQWSNDNLKIYETASAVMGNELGDNRSVIVPFTVGLDAAFQPDFLPGTFAFSVKGGLDSYQKSYAELEKEYHFAVLGFFPKESTDWYAASHLSLPLHADVTFDGSLEYRKTALENGIWAPLYSSALSSSLYGFSPVEREMFKTNAGLSFVSGIFTLSGSWIRNWKDIPVLEAENKLEVTFAVQSENAKYGVEFSAAFESGKEADSDPLLGMGGFVRVTPALRIALEAEDLLKMVSMEKREYAGKYYTRGGCAALLVKFLL